MIAGFLSSAFFAVDLLLPLGVAAGVPYAAVVLLGWWFEKPRHIFLLAAVASLLTAAGYFLSPESGIPWMVLANRSLAFLAIWITAILLAKSKHTTTELRAAHEELEQLSQARVRGIMNNVADGLITINEQGLIESVNPAAAALFGYSAKELIGRNIRLLMPGKEAGRHDGYLQQYLSSGQGKILGVGPREVVGQCKDGSTVPLELAIGEMWLGEERFFIGSIRDLSRRKQVEERLVDAVESLPIGFALYDSEDRLALCNSVYRRSVLDDFDEPAIGKPAIGKPAIGMTFQEILEIKFARGDFPIPEAQWKQRLAERMRVHRELAGPVEIQQSDGRWYLVGERRTREQGTVVTSVEITEGKQVAASLRESESRLRAIMDNTSVEIHLKDSEGRYLQINRQFEKAHGLTNQEARGKTARDILPEAAAREIEARDAAVMESGKPITHEIEVERDGKTLTYLLLRFPIPRLDGGVIGTGGVGTDITERKHMEKALRQAHSRLEQRVKERTAELEAEVIQRQRSEEALRTSEARFAGILEISPEAVISVDAKQCIQMFNRGAEAIFGYLPDEIIGQPLDILLPPHFRDSHRGMVEDFQRGAEVSRRMNLRAEVLGLRKDGTEFPASASISKFQLGSETIFTVMLHDISDRRLAENAMSLAKEEAEFANRAKSEFLANMSHELRTPLNAIIGFAEIIKDELIGAIGNDKYQDYAKDIFDSGNHLLALINDILDLSKIEAGKVEIDSENIDLSEAISACMTLMAERALEGEVQLTKNLPSSLLPALRADKRMFKQILVNLLSNAVKFTPPGGKVTVELHQGDDTGYVLCVCDTGIGIAPEDMQKALIRFGQVESQFQRKFEGTGLGLPLTQSLVELHGGTLEIDSKLGVGTRITVFFPPERTVQLPRLERRAPSARG